MSNVITINGNPIVGDIHANLKKSENQALFKTHVSCGGSSVGKPPTASCFQTSFRDLPVNIRSLINRDTEFKNLIKIVKEAGGFKRELFNAPKVAYVRSTNEYWLFDGDHSRALYKAFFPNEETMPCQIVEVDDKAQVHELFVQSNAKCKTPIKAEEVFVHEYHAQKPTAIVEESNLRSCGLMVYCSHEPGGAVGDLNGMRVKIGAARKAWSLEKLAIQKHSRIAYPNAVRDAVNILKGAGLSHTADDQIPAELLGGLTLVLSLYKDLRSVSHGTDGYIFRQWIQGLTSGQTVKQVASNLKAKGGAVVNHSEFSVALGILRNLNNIPKAPSLRNLSGKYPCGVSSPLYKTFGPKA